MKLSLQQIHDTLQQVLWTTKGKHPNFDLRSLLYQYLKTNEVQCFAREVRKSLQVLGRNPIYQMLVLFYCETMKMNNPSDSLYRKIRQEQSRFTSLDLVKEDELKQLIQNYISFLINQKERYVISLLHQKEKTNDKKIRNLKFYDKITLIQTLGNDSYTCHNYQAVYETKDVIVTLATDMGRKRENQEDSAIALEHPNISQTRLLAVADGVGGNAYGEYASAYTLTSLKKWFCMLPQEILQDPVNLMIAWQLEVKQIEQHFQKKKCPGSTTLAAAIISKEYTLALNIGDSRIYKLQDSFLTQISNDDSVAWRHYQLRQMSKEMLRFLPYSSIILNAISGTDKAKCRFHYLSKKEYDQLLLFTDGVTDCLKDTQIQKICAATLAHQTASEIVKKATDQDCLTMSIQGQLRTVDHGKDNATAIVYTKK